MDAVTPVPTEPAANEALHGLDSARAKELLARDGPNSLPERHVPPWRRLLGHFSGPVPWMLEAVALLQWALGRHLEAGVIGALLAFNALMAAWQEGRARGALSLLRQSLQVRARVLRDGQWHTLPAAELVVGDVVHVRAGDVLSADLELLDGRIAMDNAALTGESLPVEVAAGGLAFAGAVVRQGEASARVVGTGTRTRFGKTAELVHTAHAPGHMQRTLLQIVKRLLVFDAVLAVLGAGIAWWHGLPAVDILVFVLMLLVASVPVALPATYTLATALAARQLAQDGVLVTHLAAVEEAASMDTLVSDKTGTLTQNRLSCSGVQPLADGVDAAAVLRAAALASDEATQDPIDLALIEAARGQGLLQPMPARLRFAPFDPKSRSSEAQYALDAGPWLALKGAARTVAERCRLTEAQRAPLDAAAAALEREGARVLAVAAGPADAPVLLGVVGLSDPVRPDAAEVIAGLQGLGVRVRMATGDALETARAVAAQLGLGTRVCDATAADAAPDPEGCGLYARVLPEGKFAIVKSLQAAGHVTGMTGDGVNDAPALRQAELGIAVASATDVAKAAASVVLTTPGLAGVLTVVRTGREVHRRMRTYTLNKVLKTFQLVMFLTLGLLLTGRFVVSSTLIVLLLFANDFVTMSIAADRVRPAPQPQRWQVGALMRTALVLGAGMLAFTLPLYFGLSAWLGLDAAQQQTLAFVLLVFTNQAGVYVLRDDGPLWAFAPSRPMLAASAGAVALVGVMASAGWLMAAIPAALVAGLLLASAALALLLDGFKHRVFRRFGMA